MSNLPTVLSCIVVHSRALFGVLGVGLTKNHWSSPVASIIVEALYCSPVFYSGLTSLFLSKTEANSLTAYTRKILCQLQKLTKGTPVLALPFLSGSLLAEGSLHIKQFGLLLMISHLPTTNSQWFAIATLKSVAIRYVIPDPPKPLPTFWPPPHIKNMIKKRIKEVLD